MDKVRIILDKLLINNDKYIVNTIMEYTYHNCSTCKKLFDEKEYEIKRRWDDKPICNFCFLINDFRLFRCNKYFNMKTNIFCRSCVGCCKMF